MMRTTTNKLHSTSYMTAEINEFSVFAETLSVMNRCNVSLLHSFGPAEANDRSPTVTRRDGRTVSWLDDRRRLRDELTQMKPSLT